MKTKTYNVYNWDELPEEAKQKALEKYRYMEVEYNDWYEFILDEWKDKLDKIGFTNAKIYFSGFFSQGDGAVFESDIREEKLCLSLMTCNNDIGALKAEKALKLLEPGLWDCHITRTNHQYNHELCCKLYLNQYHYAKNTKYWDEFFEGFEVDLEDLRKDLCHAIYKDLETEYDYLVSDEYLIDMFINNEYEFTENDIID